MEIDKYKLYQGDCLEIMDILIKNKVKVDCIICDLPYGTTQSEWDKIIPFDEMWSRVNKITHVRSNIVLFGSEPFSSRLRMSNINNYKYDIIWDKGRGKDPMNARNRPMKRHENISIFYKKKGTYNPQMIKLDKPDVRKNNKVTKSSLWNKNGDIVLNKVYTERYPTSILVCANNNHKDRVHPSQKPIDLLEWLIKTYSNENDLILDFTMGSGSTGVACMNTNRKFIGIEIDEKYFNIAKERIEKAIS